MVVDGRRYVAKAHLQHACALPRGERRTVFSPGRCTRQIEHRTNVYDGTAQVLGGVQNEYMGSAPRTGGAPQRNRCIAGEEHIMKTAFRIASAALALAAIVSLPFSQPAQASGYADLEPSPASPDHQVFGQVFTSGPGQPVDMNAHVRFYFYVTNIGGSNSGSILTIPMCNYEASYKTKSYPAKPAYALPSLASGARHLVMFDCPRHANLEGMPTGASLTVRGANEPGELLKNNTDSIAIKYINP